MVIACKKCKKVFRRPPVELSLFVWWWFAFGFVTLMKNNSQWEDSDEYCPHCDAHLLVEPKLPEVPKGIMVQVDGADGQLLDPRVKQTKPFVPQFDLDDLEGLDI
jgi:hypothetical protein